MPDRDFEKFLGGPTPSPRDRMYVTINKENVIGMNQRCYELLGRPPAVYLHFSRARDIISIEPVHNRSFSATFPVKQKTSVGWRVNASPFCKHFNIRVDATERFVSPEINNQGHLYLKLNETVTVRQMRRKKKE